MSFPGSGLEKYNEFSMYVYYISYSATDTKHVFPRILCLLLDKTNYSHHFLAYGLPHKSIVISTLHSFLINLFLNYLWIEVPDSTNYFSKFPHLTAYLCSFRFHVLIFCWDSFSVKISCPTYVDQCCSCPFREGPDFLLEVSQTGSRNCVRGEISPSWLSDTSA